MKKLLPEELGRISVSEFKESRKVPVRIMLDNVRSLHNVGSVFRTADAFRLEHLYLTGITGCPPHREIHKTALGATASVSWSYAAVGAELLPTLRAEGYSIVAIEQTSESISLQDYQLREDNKICLVFGNELRGVDDSILSGCDSAIEIPQYGTKHSLNLSVCAGIVIWEIVKKVSRF